MSDISKVTFYLMAGEYSTVIQALENNKADAILYFGDVTYYQYLAASYFNLNQYDKCLEILLYVIKNLDVNSVKKNNEIFNVMTNYVHWYIDSSKDLTLTNQDDRSIYEYVMINCPNGAIKTRLETFIVLKKLVLAKKEEKKQLINKLQNLLPAIETDLDEFPQTIMSVYATLVKYYKEIGNIDLVKQFQEKMGNLLK
jgi:tetratricopeptide (TPR) repeat protein